VAITDTSHEFITRFFGLSTDTKPVSAMVDSTFTETDTQKKFVFDGVNWTRIPTEVVEQVGAIAVKDLLSTDDLLGEIVTQLKIQNAHLALVTGDEINEEDLEDASN